MKARKMLFAPIWKIKGAGPDIVISNWTSACVRVRSTRQYVSVSTTMAFVVYWQNA